MTEQKILVTKRCGRQEALDLDKIHKVLDWAAEGLDNVSVSQVELKSQIQLYNGIRTGDIHETIIKAAADLISDETPDYQYMAARLNIFHLRKIAYGRFTPPRFFEHVKNLVDKGFYDKHLLEDYIEEDFDYFEKHVDHDRDMSFSYAAVKQLEGKYLVQNRVTGEVYESPQYLYMLIGMCLFADYPLEERFDYIVKFYDTISTFKISLPTPIMAGVRTPSRQFSSCVKIDTGDSLDSINATTSSIVKYVSLRAGIGINAGAIRAVDSPIRGGEARHTGCIPFYKLFQAAVKSCSQGGVRGGAATLYYPIWHSEVESLLVLKNNRGVEENRVRHIDYAVQISKIFYQRLIKGERITVFSPSDVPGLYDAFFEDQVKFEELYLKYEQDDSIEKRSIPATELFSLLMQERSGTGRIYIQNVDHCNTHSPFDSKIAPIKMSNLCVSPETKLLTKDGYTPIAELEGEQVDVWNGEEWSRTEVVKTGENQKLLTVTTSAGQEIDCTEYHKFYVFDGYGKPFIEKRAHELKAGDKLEKFDLPIVDGWRDLDKAYINGFYTGDGTKVANKQRIYLYNDKRKLKDTFDEGGKWYVQENQNRMHKEYDDLMEKYFVPCDNYSIYSRLEWLAGWLDADGCVYRNGRNEALTGSSTNKEFLQDVQQMLQTLGVSCKISKTMDAGLRPMPKNDGSGELGLYNCSESYRLLITSYDSYKLLDLGLKLDRLKIKKRRPQRDAKQFNTVVSVEDHGRFDDTYCVNEPKRHKVMFNGILTGQCLEIALPTKPLNDINDPNGEIALCTLSAFNLGMLESLDELEELADLVVRALDALLDYQDYPMTAAEIPAKNRRSLGIGVINYAYYLAKNGVKYSDGSANNLTHRTFEAVQYYLLKASNNLAKEQGACGWFDQTTYSQGILPIDTYKKDIDNICDEELHYDWESLRSDIKQYGLRNSTLTALMPSETSSQISNSTNGIEPPRGLISVKQSKDGILKQVVPEHDRLRDQYELLWDIPNNDGYLQLAGIMQKFVDQSISTNTNYDPSKFESGRVPMKVLLKDLLTAYKLGLKTLYYQNTRDGADDSQETIQENNCESGACMI